MLSCCLWMDERNHRPTKQQVENCRKECQEHWQGLRELCWKFTVDVLEWGECQHTHLPGCLGGVNAFPSTAALNSFAFLHFLVLARSFAPYREERWPRSSKNPRFFKSIHLPEIDIASPWVLKGESSFGALPLRLVVIAHVLISTLIWLNPQPQRNQLRETCLLLNLRAAAVQKTKPSQIPWEKKWKLQVSARVCDVVNHWHCFAAGCSSLLLGISRLPCGFVSCANTPDLSQKWNLGLVGFSFSCLLPLSSVGIRCCVGWRTGRSYCALPGSWGSNEF